MDPNLAAAYRVVRDATFCNEDISTADKIAVLELVKHEILTNALANLSGEED